MKVGKLPTHQLESLLHGRVGALRKDVLVLPGIGKDCGVVDFGEEVCIISTDPITGAAKRIGRLAVHVSCNDVAASGGEPIGVQIAILLPESAADSVLTEIMDDVHQACSELGITVLGGHTEITSTVSEPLVVTTALGRCPKSAYLTSTGYRPGEAVLVTKAVGLEGSAILANEYAQELQGVAAETLREASQYLEEVSVVKEALAARDAGASAMHDITEGGLFGAVAELAHASGLGLYIKESLVPVRSGTRTICDRLGLDPLGLISSGSLLVITPHPEEVIEAVSAIGSTAAVVGHVMESGQASFVERRDGTVERLPNFYEDELWRFSKRLSELGERQR